MELYHYGVPGMKWGIRRYQNTDGSLTNAGKRRYAKNIKEQYKSKDGFKELTTNIQDDVTAHFKTQIDKHVDEIRNARKLMQQVSLAGHEYYRVHYKNDRSRAYKETYDYFEKNDPAYLRSIVDKNKGDKNTLIKFHDFDKVFDGYLDDAITNGLNRAYEKKRNQPKGCSARKPEVYRSMQISNAHDCWKVWQYETSTAISRGT